jgi:hypothetical protein
VVCLSKSLGKALPNKGDEREVPRCGAALPRERANIEETEDERTRDGAGGSGPQVCHFCYQSFALQEDLVKHLKEAHGVEEETASSE